MLLRIFSVSLFGGFSFGTKVPAKKRFFNDAKPESKWDGMVEGKN